MDTSSLVDEQTYDESKLLMISDNVNNMAPRQEIIWQIDQCNRLINIINNYKHIHNKYVIVMDDLTENIRNVACNTAINWTVINLFKKIDEFIIQIPRKNNKHHNEVYYISLGTLAGIFYNKKNDTYCGTSCLMVFVNHKKKTYHLYPLVKFKHHKLQIYCRHLRPESVKIIRDILNDQPSEITVRHNNIMH